MVRKFFIVKLPPLWEDDDMCWDNFIVFGKYQYHMIIQALWVYFDVGLNYAMLFFHINFLWMENEEIGWIGQVL